MMPGAGLASPRKPPEPVAAAEHGLAPAAGEGEQRRGGAEAEQDHDAGRLQHGLALGSQREPVRLT